MKMVDDADANADTDDDDGRTTSAYLSYKLPFQPSAQVS